MYQEKDIEKLHLGLKQNDNSSSNSVHDIVNRMLLCSSSLLYSPEELPEKYGINICTLKNMTKKNSPCVAEMVRFLDALGVSVETDKSPYINFHLNAEDLKEKATTKKNKIRELIVEYTNKTGRPVEHFIDYNELDTRLVHSVLKSENNSKGEEFNNMLELMAFFNIEFTTAKPLV